MRRGETAKKEGKRKSWLPLEVRLTFGTLRLVWGGVVRGAELVTRLRASRAHGDIVRRRARRISRKS
jgi:hypothetical protein